MCLNKSGVSPLDVSMDVDAGAHVEDGRVPRFVAGMHERSAEQPHKYVQERSSRQQIVNILVPLVKEELVAVKQGRAAEQSVDIPMPPTKEEIVVVV